MNAINAIIVDDEEDNRSVLRSLLGMYCENIHVAGEASNIESAYELINSVRPDVVFLDVQMPGGNGFSLLKKFDTIPFDVVFVTGYDKYALEAIRLSALHYLLKPVEVSDLQEAVRRIESSKSSKELTSQVGNAQSNMADNEKRIHVHTNDQVLFIPLRDITHFESDRNYTVIHLRDKKYKTSKNLGEYEKMLEGNRTFFRIDKSAIVNTAFITNYGKGEPCVLTVDEKHRFEVSRRRKKDLLELLRKNMIG